MSVIFELGVFLGCFFSRCLFFLFAHDYVSFEVETDNHGSVRFEVIIFFFSCISLVYVDRISYT